MSQLRGTTVLVTGAGRGLGEGIARKLLDYGATVIAVSRTESELHLLAQNAADAPGNLNTISVDIGDRGALKNLISIVSTEYGGIDALINNAAILRMQPFVSLSEEDFDETIEVNLLAPARLIRGFLPEMRRKGRGAIINVTSGAATRGFVNETDYCTTKYGIEGFSYSLALELADENISVNLVTPGFAIKPTSVTVAEFDDWTFEQKQKYRDPIEMADAFAFLTQQFPKEGGVTGKRFDAYKLSQQVRDEGWDTPA